MEIIGKVVKLGNLTEGTSARGQWRKQELIIQTEEQYPRTVCLLCWGDTATEAQNLQAEQMIKAQFRLESREFNGKWYTDATVWRIETAQSQAFTASTQQQVAQQTSTTHQTPPIQSQPIAENNSIFEANDPSDDLPF